MSLGGSELLAGLMLAELLTLGGLAYALARLGRARRAARRAAELGDGAVMLVEDGRIRDASDAAAALLAPQGGLAGRPVRPLLEGFLEGSRDGALAAYDRLEARGEGFELIVRDRAGRPYALLGEPRGGLLRLVLRDAGVIDAERTRTRSEASARDRSSAARESERDVLAGLIDAAPVAAWRRAADGTVSWSAGRVPTPQRTIEAAEAAALAAARQSSKGEAKSGRFRLEVGAGEGTGDGAGEGARPGALEAIEVPAPGGGHYGLAVDGSGALEAERRLARFVRTMTETFAHLHVGLAIFDQNQRLALFNPALLDMWQIDPVWLAQRPSLREILDRLRANRRVPEAADFRAWRRRLTDLFEDIEAADYEELWHLADGSDIRVLARPHPHGSLAFVFEDVTERLKLEQQFRHSIDLRRATLNRLEEGLAVFGPDGLVQFVNAAFHDIWGTDEETVRPLMHVRELIEPIGGLTVETEVWTRLIGFITGADSRQPWGARLTLGTGRILGARFAGLPDGSTMAVFGDVTDSERIATALRQRNEALEAAEEMRGAMLDQISHRLRTPLHTVFGFGQLLVDARFGALNDTQRGYAEQILDSARQLLGAVDDVTELASLEIEPLVRDGAEPSLGDTLLLTGRLLEKRAAEAGVTLRVELPDTEMPPACEPGRLRQIVFGLATAAMTNCREDGELALGARAGAGGTVEVQVAVTALEPVPGAGPAAQCPGLTFIRRLAAQSGGEIELRPAEDGERMVALCRFPLAAGTAPAGPAEAGG
ncbi:MAG TPA: PAS-domain containing protein [Thermohalobaculum sp.]|nr:PAS-domain containing protein [Thermohalobaculum sp.]